MNKSLKCEASVALGRQLAPLSQGGGAVLLEDFASVEVAFLIEMIVDRSMDGSEFLPFDMTVAANVSERNDKSALA